MPKSGKKTSKAAVGVPSIWGSDRGNPYALPWAYTVVAGESRANKGISLRDASGVSALTLPSFHLNEAESVDNFYRFLTCAMKACFQARSRWDYEFAQQIISLFIAARKMAKAIGRLKKENRVLANDWWETVSPEQGDAFRRVEALLVKHWDEGAQALFREREKAGRRLRYYRHARPDVGFEYVTDAGGKPLLLVEAAALPVGTESLRETWKRGAPGYTQWKHDPLRPGRFAYWHVVTETLNAFAHLDEKNVALPALFPQLAQDLRLIQKPLSRLAQMLGKHEGKPIRNVLDLLDEAFACFDAPEDKNHPVLRLSKDERKELYRQRGKKYRANLPTRHDPQPSLFDGLEDLAI